MLPCSQIWLLLWSICICAYRSATWLHLHLANISILIVFIYLCCQKPTSQQSDGVFVGGRECLTWSGNRSVSKEDRDNTTGWWAVVNGTNQDLNITWNWSLLGQYLLQKLNTVFDVLCPQPKGTSRWTCFSVFQHVGLCLLAKYSQITGQILIRLAGNNH